MTTVTDNNATHNDTEITDEMREVAWYAFQEDQGFAERIEMAPHAVDAVVQEVTYRALMQHPAMIRAYCASAQDEWAVSHEEWQELWDSFAAPQYDAEVATHINTMPAPAPTPQPNEGGHWVVERRGFVSEEWSEVYEGTLEMCEVFLAGAVLGLDEDALRITRPQRETDRIVQALNENESDVLGVLREHWGGFEEAIQDAISGLVSSALDDILFDNPSAVLAEGECPVAFLRALVTK